ncbi:Regulator of chromosome condensation (RCC1) repeat-containing protein [Anaerovirgula multivorans]|uniref:Regulator of chromosome condensation (RCC1) repeat-containing protein n=1 Tax=Anaerovirgula multivorans TaxID=312168 RepID=A0A239C832_9FIRM|nr:RCC1 domain-containing protein [Anaerovirgula multivorans]SNS15543.1 Regulator of chromosome condensation (RCC1) repeat-containing protein [Anaerovirgula multivorans]
MEKMILFSLVFIMSFSLIGCSKDKWRVNEYGQLGNGTLENKLKPVKIMDNVLKN